MKRVITVLVFLVLVSSANLFAQEKTVTAPTEYGNGFKVNFNEDGSKYFRLINWHQFWLNGQLPVNSDADFTVTPMLRRSRLLMFAQLSDRFLIVTHFGLNSLTPSGLDPTGQSSQAQLFMHDAWVEYKVNKYLYMGGGLHYWNGISRLNNQSTLNFLPLDNARHTWATIGTSDQFGRHLGVYAKGKLGKLDYRVAWNSAMVNSIDANGSVAPQADKASYIGRKTFGTKASNIYAGYFNYQFFDQESNKLPYMVGSYFGSKKIFNIGAGFLTHPKGSVILVDSVETAENVLIWAVDAFTDLPIGQKKAAFTGYFSYQSNNYGRNYQLGGGSQDVFTGYVTYFQGGLVLPNNGKFAWQPYVTFTQKHINALDSSPTDYGIGINALISGHNAKLTLEYRHLDLIGKDDSNQIIFQAAIFL
jgi:hypothetical protein